MTGESAAGVDLVHAGEPVGRIDLGPKPGGYAPLILNCWPPWPRRPRQQSPTFGWRLSSRDSKSCPPLGSVSLPRRTRSDVGSSATCMTESSRRWWH